jgi:hypothetical protein
VHKSEDLWIDIRATSEHLSELSLHLREAALEARHAAHERPERNSFSHLELLQNLKNLADRVRDILWRELQESSNRTPAAKAESSRRAVELFALLAKIGEAQQEGSQPVTFFESIESVVERTLDRAHQPDPSGSSPSSRPKAA